MSVMWHATKVDFYGLEHISKFNSNNLFLVFLFLDLKNHGDKCLSYLILAKEMFLIFFILKRRTPPFSVSKNYVARLSLKKKI